METRIRVSEIMTKNVVTVDVKTNLMDVAKLIKKHRVGSAIVMDGDTPLGIVTERDMVEKVIALDIVPSQTISEDVMSTPLLSVSPDTSVFEASKIMLKQDIRRLAVVDDSGGLAGIITVVDILSVSEELAEIYDDLITQRRQRPTVPFGIEGFDTEECIQGRCESCGSFSEDLVDVDGRLLCENCRT